VSAFVSVVEAGSFTAAARALALPKSSISRRVSHLEDALGVRLLQRTTRQLRLTDAGREYFERVSSALAGVQEAHAAIADLQDRPKGIVRLAASTEWGGWLLAPIVSMFIEQYPEIRVDLSITDRTVDLVKDGFDLALSSGPLADSSLLVRTIESLESGLFAAPAYLEKHGTPASVADLTSHAFILRRPGPTNRLQLFGAKTETVVVTGPVTTDDRSFGFEAVRAGLGIGVLPIRGCAGTGLMHLLPSYRLGGISTHIVYPASRHIPQRVVLFREFLAAHLDSHGEGMCGKAAGRIPTGARR
jgi:DNA-binding transcriptional LysR family regulator